MQSLVDDLERRFPEDTVVRFSYLPVLRARAVLNQGDAAKALELLQSAAPSSWALPACYLERSTPSTSVARPF